MSICATPVTPPIPDGYPGDNHDQAAWFLTGLSVEQVRALLGMGFASYHASAVGRLLHEGRWYATPVQREP